MRKTLIFGNGLGMVLDPVHFTLYNALNSVWNSSLLDENQKRLISLCTPTMNGCPFGEEELDKLHLAISSCDYLMSISKNRDFHWLSQYGLDFPKACKSYISKVAIHLHDYSGPALPHLFSESLSSFIRKTNSHVATLNYDKLLYELFIENGILNGFSGHLVDGITNSGFDAKNFIRKYGKKFGYYLHLHGSPLFKEKFNTIYKITRAEFNPDLPDPNNHIVLTHIDHKVAVIGSSSILFSYWQQLGLALAESEEVILFGYSGNDFHLNSYLSLYKDRVKFKVVEWSSSGSIHDSNLRRKYWESALNSNIDLIRLDRITDFYDW